MHMITVWQLTFSSHFMNTSSHFHFARTYFTLLGIEIISSIKCLGKFDSLSLALRVLVQMLVDNFATSLVMTSSQTSSKLFSTGWRALGGQTEHTPHTNTPHIVQHITEHIKLLYTSVFTITMEVMTWRRNDWKSTLELFKWYVMQRMQ